MIDHDSPAAAPHSALRAVFFGPRGLRAGWRILLVHAIFLALSGAILWSVQRAFGGMKEGPFTVDKLILVEGVYVVVGIVAIGAMARIERRRFADYGIPGLRTLFGRRFWTGAVWGVVAVGAAALAAYLGGAMTVRGLSRGALVSGALLWGLGTLLGSLAEELFFRGYFLSALRDGLGFWPAAILQSLFFGFVLHYLEKDNETLLDGLNVSLIGLFFCWTVLRTGDIAWASGIHFTYNFTSFFLVGSPNTAFGGPATPHLLDTAFGGPAWLTGGPTGLEASVPTTLVFLALFLVLRRRPGPGGSGKLAAG